MTKPQQLVTLILQDKPPSLDDQASLVSDPQVLGRFPFHRRDATLLDLIPAEAQEDARWFWSGWRNGDWFEDTEAEVPRWGGLRTDARAPHDPNDTMLVWLDPPPAVWERLERLHACGAFALMGVRLFETKLD